MKEEQKEEEEKVKKLKEDHVKDMKHLKQDYDVCSKTKA